MMRSAIDHHVLFDQLLLHRDCAWTVVRLSKPVLPSSSSFTQAAMMSDLLVKWTTGKEGTETVSVRGQKSRDGGDPLRRISSATVQTSAAHAEA